MLLDFIKNFSWYNEPFSISFDELGMNLESFKHTDFWQAREQGIKKDSGHFFYTNREDDFVLKLKWKFEDCSNFNQCGAMIRIDEKTWFKISIMTASHKFLQLGSSLTHGGFSDWSIYPLDKSVNEIFYKIKKDKNNFFVYYSLDDLEYKQIRQFAFSCSFSNFKVGAYIASPGNQNFKSTLERIELV